MTKAKIVSINNAPTVCDYSGIRGDVTDLNKILDNIDEAEGRNDALRQYIYALRDLQRAHNMSGFADIDRDPCLVIDKAHAAVEVAFDRLTIAELTLRNYAG